MATKKTESKLTFEQAMARLDEIVRRLEQSDACVADVTDVYATPVYHMPVGK